MQFIYEDDDTTLLYIPHSAQGSKVFFLDSCALSGVSIFLEAIGMLDQIVRSHVAHTLNSEKPKSGLAHLQGNEKVV